MYFDNLILWDISDWYKWLTVSLFSKVTFSDVILADQEVF